MTAHNPNMPRLSAGDFLFCPGGEEERNLRERITAGRDIAWRMANSDRPDEVRAIYTRALHLANDWITRPAAIDHLRLVRYACLRLVLAAQALEKASVADG